MLKNVGSTDRLIRIISALVIIALIITGAVEGTAAIILGVLAGILFLTGSVSTCPIYMALGMSTNRKSKKV
jgi:hypothetical protein